MLNKLFSDTRDNIVKKVLGNNAQNFTNKDITILSNNCIGGIILNHLEQRFNSPTVNLYFNAPDFLKFLERVDYYLAKEITFSYQSKYEEKIMPYPIGTIEDIEMHFVHYESFEDAKDKWEKRSKRINHDNIFVIGSDIGHCTPELIDQFLSLPYKNKIFFSSKKHPSKNVVFFKEYVNDKEVGDLINADNAWYFHFDTIGWLNTGKIKRNHTVTFLFNLYRSGRKKYQQLANSQAKYEKSKAKMEHQH
ncbi:hypothetical protein BH11BAC3_BH11BAC3_06200 [soil metagenome]